MAERNTREPIHWVWFPAAAIYTVVTWLRLGPVISLAGLAAGVALGMWGRHRGAARRRAGG
jgi:hypothetical protein